MWIHSFRLTTDILAKGIEMNRPYLLRWWPSFPNCGRAASRQLWLLASSEIAPPKLYTLPRVAHIQWLIDLNFDQWGSSERPSQVQSYLRGPLKLLLDFTTAQLCVGLILIPSLPLPPASEMLGAFWHKHPTRSSPPQSQLPGGTQP